MANHKSAVKRAKQNKVRNLRNKSIRTRVKNLVKAANTAIQENSIESAQKTLIMAQSTIDKAKKKKVLHRNTAARKISRLFKKVNNMTQQAAS